jgi:hypothetical protein
MQTPDEPKPLEYANPENAENKTKPRHFRLDVDRDRNLRSIIAFALLALLFIVALFALVTHL